MRWQYWALGGLEAFYILLAVALGHRWPIVSAAVAAWLVWITQHHSDRRLLETEER